MFLFAVHKDPLYEKIYLFCFVGMAKTSDKL